MSICGHNSGTYTHDRTKDVLIQCRIHMVLEPPIASKHIPRSNMAAKLLLLMNRAYGRKFHFSHLGDC
jgi:hypothetical protein